MSGVWCRYRSHASALYASVRIDGKTQSNWSDIALTNIPNDDSNINAGVLPEGNGVFLVANGVPARVRDPVTLSMSQDGLNWSSCRVAQTCTDFPEIPKSTCKGRCGCSPCSSYPPFATRWSTPEYPSIQNTHGSPHNSCEQIRQEW
jgi:hypothetical protein